MNPAFPLNRFDLKEIPNGYYTLNIEETNPQEVYYCNGCLFGPLESFAWSDEDTFKFQYICEYLAREKWGILPESNFSSIMTENKPIIKAFNIMQFLKDKNITLKDITI